MKNWKILATANGLGIPEEQLDRITPSLDALEAAFRPLAAGIPFEIEPAIILSEQAIDNQ